MALFPYNNGTWNVTAPYTIWDLVLPSWSPPLEMSRVGRLGDGGKWTCGMSRYEAMVDDNKPCVVYSFGVKDDSSFEDEFLSRVPTAEVWAYDLDVCDFEGQLSSLSPAQRGSRAHFTHAAIGGKTDAGQTPPVYGIGDVMRMNGHGYVDMLKMDIEGSEFEALDALLVETSQTTSDELPIGQLLIEVHFRTNERADGFLKWWERLEARGLRAIWTEPNSLGNIFNCMHGDSLMAIEYTFVNVRDRRSRIFGGLMLD
ncbi:hypothetical protein N0V82_002387 [Gnomoniopsis sp. IMI 355080]|nr:hypothetical protein N0V82_002387 [Gnomoniopsis sp. IMI 355080]